MELRVLLIGVSEVVPFPLFSCVLVLFGILLTSLGEERELIDMSHVMRHVMRKPVYAICEQQMRLISAFVVRCLDSIIPSVSISEIASL